MGLGAPIADYQGVIGAPGLAFDRRAVPRVRVGRIDLTQVPAPQPILCACAPAEGSWIAELAGGGEAYRAPEGTARRIRPADGQEIPQADREKGALRFTACRTIAPFRPMLGWKART